MGYVSLKIFDVLGKEVAALVQEDKQPGSYTATWDAGKAPSGVYYARMSVTSSTGAQPFQSTKKLILMK
jgi:hypothetical protein